MRVRRVLCWATALTAILASEASAQPAPRRVLFLHSYEPQFVPSDIFAGNFRTDLSEHAITPVQFFELSLQPVRVQGAIDPEPVIQYVRAMFAAQPLDLVVPIGGPAAQFVEQHREEIFPSTPMLFAAVDRRLLDDRLLTDRDAVVPVACDPALMVDTILRVLPKTTNLFIVIGTSPPERFWRAELATELELFAERVIVSWSDGLGEKELLARVAALPGNSAILYIFWSADAQGDRHGDERALQQLHAVASAPIFGIHTSQLGRGIVGGPLLDIDLLSRNAAAAALRVLHGEPGDIVRLPTQLPGPPIFDARELQRWHISESTLPEGSVVRFTEPAPRSRWPLFIGISVCVVEGVLIAALIGNRRERLDAERALAELSRNLMQTQEEERARIARELYEDLCQRIVALTVQLQLVGAHASPEAANHVAQISAEMENLIVAAQSLSRRLHTSTLELLGIDKTVTAFCRELASQHGVDIDVGMDGDLRDVPADVGLALFRVLQEALQNAIEHSGAHHFVVRLFGGSREIDLSVRDDGVGFDVQSAMRSHGLGLVAMQQRLTLVGGTVLIESRLGAGTTVRAVVPWHDDEELLDDGELDAVSDRSVPESSGDHA